MEPWIKVADKLTPYLPNIVGSVVLLIALQIAHAGARRLLMRRHWETEEGKLRWTVRLRTTFAAITVFGMVGIWASQLQTLALSAVAFAAALVLATKELIMCISGGVVRVVSEGFTLGDRVEIGSSRGEVIRLGVFTTTILEIGPGHQRTGRALVVPNSQLLTQTVINETFTDAFVLHVVTVPVKRKEDWRKAQEALLEAAQETCAPYIDEARRHLNRVADRNGLSLSVIEPRVIVQLPDPEKINLLLRVAMPARDKGRYEQEILRHYLDRTSPPDAPHIPDLDDEPLDDEDEDDATHNHD